ncbi:MAG TPA: hypothetical protein PJ998_07170 [Terrimesophilobacter sp.]|nr:hypothetical protein [Terrimesophilobacter sp.]
MKSSRGGFPITEVGTEKCTVGACVFRFAAHHGDVVVCRAQRRDGFPSNDSRSSEYDMSQWHFFSSQFVSARPVRMDKWAFNIQIV